ncbi:unnamed protein product [Linum tenue]|uniref:Non-specific serine/threonine protein kinase n=1 Tax=Linum tenue TaxID=586396 RepID=A0AAV0IFB2_9ROSI|nr:unnamed protein product [Linum tenue]
MDSSPNVDHAAVVDKFKLGTKIGKGSFGKLYQGTNLEIREQVAIKIESTWAGRVYLIDYGLANRYRDLRDHRRHIYVEDKVGFAGTAIYASVSVHRGVEQSRRDNLESLGYALVYFLRGGLPWQDLTRNGKTDWRYEKMGEMTKVSISEESLREGLPYDFVAYFRYCRRELRFEDEPDYEYLKGMFRGLFVTEGFEFDWTVPRC